MAVVLASLVYPGTAVATICRDKSCCCLYEACKPCRGRKGRLGLAGGAEVVTRAQHTSGVLERASALVAPLPLAPQGALLRSMGYLGHALIELGTAGF